MRSHARNNRRHRGNKGQDDDHYLVPQEDTETYPRLHKPSHQTESYRSSPASNRAPYDSNREGSTSRSRHLDSWRYADPDEDRHNYASHDGYHRHSGGRDEYEYAETRDPEPWSSRPHHDVRYSQSHDEWSQRYDHGYLSSSYAESSSWTPSLLDSRNTSFDHWPAEETRLDDRRGMPVSNDTHREEGWQHHQDKGHHKFKSDSGWDTRRGGKGWDEPHVWDDPSNEKGRSKVEDRSWEPAPSWQPSGRRDSEHNSRNNQRNNNANRNSKGGKRGAYANKQKRDWRNDDGNLNNWTKRASHGTQDRAPKTQGGKHLRSLSRSRSRSPAESYYSRRSSRGRSKSRSVSPSPKRRRRAISPAAPHSRTPSERGRTWIPSAHLVKRHSPSPTSGRSPASVVDTRRSISSTSSVSTERSPSRSPTRAIHRLPPMTAPTSLSPTSQRTSGSVRDTPQRNGKPHSNGKQSNIDRRRTATLGEVSSIDSMPPPTTIPTSHKSRMIYPSLDVTSLTSVFSERKAEIPAPTRFTPSKYAGFKPITQTNSALKKFFPGDDDDMELASSSSAGHGMEETTNERDTFFHSAQRDEAGHHGSTRLSPFQAVVKNATHNGITFSPQQDPSPLLDTAAVDDVLRLKSPGSQDKPELDTSEVPVASSMGAPDELYKIISQVGEGTFGKVYKAQNTITKLHVALKRIRMESEKDGFPVTAMREIKLLQSLRHANIVQLYEMMVSNGSVYMVFEYMDHDLTGVLSQTQFTFTDAHLKSLCHQMLAGLAYLHHKGVIHRDIKGSNILINNRGELKLGDFGLARFYQKRRCTDYTNRVITLWYRPPELLFGATVYGPEVDMWSAGCIMLELFTKKPVFQGNDEIHQLDVVYKIIGTPTPERWAGVLDLPWYELVKPRDAIPNHFRELFQKWMSPAALDLAERLLAYDPSQRVTAIQAMDAPYFTQEEPRAAPPVGLATLEGEWHELETKRERAKRRRKPEPGMQ